MEYIYLISVAILLLAVGFYFLRPARPGKVVRPSAPRLPRISRTLSPEEREMMLSAVRSMVQSEPEKTAGVLRQWLAEEAPPENQTKNRK